MPTAFAVGSTAAASEGTKLRFAERNRALANAALVGITVRSELWRADAYHVDIPAQFKRSISRDRAPISRTVSAVQKPIRLDHIGWIPRSIRLELARHRDAFLHAGFVESIHGESWFLE